VILILTSVLAIARFVMVLARLSAVLRTSLTALIVMIVMVQGWFTTVILFLMVLMMVHVLVRVFVVVEFAYQTLRMIMDRPVALTRAVMVLSNVMVAHISVLP